ncbi:DUF4331 domain-containing protein [Chondromyces apiculatus]|uniref:DUF4331 domain-containing protein n=1 Tax=Chondromyces apiculatus DSM 436 TaxID=1192034 RepID=A0A017TB91_9BACT|nr:DUF4331 domain-containing protein [Chondromyces apiculatus]EYF05901.1 Hypothetical protein CAP_2903 [Chondromyces apiculatus DSM 436]
MRKHLAWIGTALAALGVLSASPEARASSHREAPAIASDPAADNTDLYAWVQGSNLVILANYIPFQPPAGGPNYHAFSDDVLYEVHIVRGPTSLEDAITYQIRFSTTPVTVHDPAALDPTPAGGNEFFSQIAGAVQTYSVTKVVGGNAVTLIDNVPVAPPNIGPRSNVLAYGAPAAGYPAFSVSSTFLRLLANNEGRVWAGPRDDSFYGDLGHLYDLGGLCPMMVAPNPPCTARNHVGGYNVHTIALELPLTRVNGGAVIPGASDAQTVGVWASASRRKVRVLRAGGTHDDLGPWVQVSRAGIPLMNDVVIGLQDKDRYNSAHPRDDFANFGPYLLNPMLVRNAEYAGLYGAGQPLAAYAAQLPELRANRTDIIEVLNLGIPILGNHTITSVGDVLRVDLGTPSIFPNGRPINLGQNTEQTDVTDLSLTLVLTGTIALTVSDGVNTNDRLFLTTFPYLAPPWEGANESHYK